MQIVDPPAYPPPAGEVEVTLPVPRIRPFTCRGPSGRGKSHPGCYATEGKSQWMTACGEARGGVNQQQEDVSSPVVHREG